MSVTRMEMSSSSVVSRWTSLSSSISVKAIARHPRWTAASASLSPPPQGTSVHTSSLAPPLRTSLSYSSLSTSAVRVTRTASDEPAAVAGTIVVELKEGKNVACIDVFCVFVPCM